MSKRKIDDKKYQNCARRQSELRKDYAFQRIDGRNRSRGKLDGSYRREVGGNL